MTPWILDRINPGTMVAALLGGDESRNLPSEGGFAGIGNCSSRFFMAGTLCRLANIQLGILLSKPSIPVFIKYS